MDTFEKLSRKLASIGIKTFEASVKPEKSWLAFGVNGTFYFVRFKSIADITTLEDLLDGAEATGVKAEEIVKASQSWRLLMPSVRDDCRPDGVAWARSLWAKEKTAGKWAKAEEQQKKAEVKVAHEKAVQEKML